MISLKKRLKIESIRHVVVVLKWFHELMDAAALIVYVEHSFVTGVERY